MSQKPQIIIEEKSQFNILDESAKFISGFSLLGFIGLAFMLAMGKQNLILMCVLSITTCIGIYFRIVHIFKSKNQNLSIKENN